MSGTHAWQANAEIILPLSKMGIYSTWDVAAKSWTLDTLSPAQIRLRKAFDQAFLPNMEQRGKLVLSTLPEWEGWRIPPQELVRLGPGPRGLQQVSLEWLVSASVEFVHSCGGSTQHSSQMQGASRRLKEDVPEMAALLHRWVVFVSGIETVGINFRAAFSGLFPASPTDNPNSAFLSAK
ncbi:hypothetical protein B0H13DRAFT_1888715 [Mycena leptocephala]|nr:hypothetical protein B0H13DRAFT_1888715 [Mycena leptocephala]